MARAAEIYGLSAIAVDGITGYAADALTATGSANTDAYKITTSVAQFTTTAASTGAILPVSNSGDEYIISNQGASTLSVYPPSGGKINNGTADAAFSIATTKSAVFRALTSANFVAVLSA